MRNPDRRQALRAALAGSAALIIPAVVKAQEAGFTLPKLPYAFDALEPHIDAKTMEIHWGRHHKAYVDNLNKALAGNPDWLKKPITDILKGINEVPATIRQAVINNGGGHHNHTLFWEAMGPKAGGEPTGPLAKAIDAAFESFAKFQEKLTAAGMTRFGSGWAWLVSDSQGKLDVISTANQDSPLMMTPALTPLVGVDVWEHAYYLKYQNKRADYLAAWFKTVDWKVVAERHAKAGK
jgi:Fe-Mn family superoxide dismutase